VAEFYVSLVFFFPSHHRRRRHEFAARILPIRSVGGQLSVSRGRVYNTHRVRYTVEKNTRTRAHARIKNKRGIHRDARVQISYAACARALLNSRWTLCRPIRGQTGRRRGCRNDTACCGGRHACARDRIKVFRRVLRTPRLVRRALKVKTNRGVGFTTRVDSFLKLVRLSVPSAKLDGNVFLLPPATVSTGHLTNHFADKIVR